MAGTTNNRWEDSPGSIISCKASFAHTRSIVNDKSSNIFVTHFEVELRGEFVKSLNVGVVRDKCLSHNAWVTAFIVCHLGYEPTNIMQTL